VLFRNKAKHRVPRMAKARLIQTILSVILARAYRGPWWEIIPDDFRVVFSLALFFISLFVLVVVLYLAGLVVVGRKRTLLTDAFTISLIGIVLSITFFLFVPIRIVALLLSIFVWLLLIKRLYKTDWLGATAVGILAMIIFLAITILLAIFFGIIAKIFDLLSPFMIAIL